MYKAIFLILFSIIFVQELEVDGDLKVTGNIQSTTIDSLISLIVQLEQRIAQLECQNTGIIPDGYCDCFFHTLDECNVCGGDNSTCLDCAGLPNGDAQQDMCGVCDNDSSNDCLQDCSGEWGGTAEYDICGDCAGAILNAQDCSNFALSFNGNGEANIDMNPDFSPGMNEFTINIWVKFDDINDFNQTILGADSDCAFTIMYSHAAATGNERLSYWLSSANSCHDIIGGTHPPAINPGIGMKSDWIANQWYYLTAVKDGSNYSFYVDGLLDYSVSAGSSDILIDFSLGGINSSYLKGDLDQFSIWDYAFDVDGILEIQNYFITGNEPGLIGFWNFNTGSGNTFYDYSVNNNHGNIGSAIWVERE